MSRTQKNGTAWVTFVRVAVSSSMAATISGAEALARSLPDVHLPVLRPRLAPVERAVALPVGRVARDARPREPRKHVLPVVAVPLTEKIDAAALESPAPHQEVPRRRRVGPGVLPASERAVVRAQAEALD